VGVGRSTQKKNKQTTDNQYPFFVSGVVKISRLCLSDRPEKIKMGLIFFAVLSVRIPAKTAKMASSRAYKQKQRHNLLNISKLT
jgi:hypothetical protein